MPVRIKICGITSAADAQAAVAAGADALGFVFYEKSPRYVTPAQAREIMAGLPPLVVRVGVMVNPAAELVQQAVQAGIQVLQFHGEETPEVCRQQAVPVIKGFRLQDELSLLGCREYTGLPWLLDSYVAGQAGGTGAVFNWELAVKAKASNPVIILAGGLTPDNVAEAVRRVRPYAVDVSSGVESAPGKKDAAKMRAFVAAVRAA
ncbi:phosphoribosylanthranilate isomerase [Fontisphaera persica]|uniref:phosphoribosylanthranilate isomerase n=1 Tax=Fontisphaera persica TaxID=2974023 RepID=UPI0024BFAAEF|nr:phosphoribosylanthranilate isomerase [Fontisphaera persica]WCJ58906.1 phosphoribosylanthranilate isomerase [Fontisphaera persica]